MHNRDKTGLGVKALKIVNRLLEENPEIRSIFESSETVLEARLKLRNWVEKYLDKNPHTKNYYLKKATGHSALKKIAFRDYAAIRLMDYLDNEGRSYIDLNNNDEVVISNPVKNLWLAIRHGKGSATDDFFLDMYYLFRQIKGSLYRRKYSGEQINEWMNRHPTGLDEDMIQIRRKNKQRIIRILIEKMDSAEIVSKRFSFVNENTFEEKYRKVEEWWNDYRFHLVFAIRTPELLNEMLDFSLREKELKILKKAQQKKIPLFVNPHYLSLISVDISPSQTGADSPIRDYILPSKELVNEFGSIRAWEKEDVVQPGEPNEAGWLLPPYNNVHRRYPESAIFIPDTVGRACGGLCVSCQRMYDFQNGHFNFDLEKLTPKISWTDKMKMLLQYWEQDTQLRDILITGGDALMSSDKSLKRILDEVYEMALRKKNANHYRPKNKKYAEIVRVRLGTRIPVYIPQRITDELASILHEFKAKASEIGIRQFIIQTHIQSSVEVTPEMKAGVEKLLKAGWMVTNQQVFTSSSARRGHSIKLRKTMIEMGIVPYYTFSVKGFRENLHNFATNARIAQERVEEKYLGYLPKESVRQLSKTVLEGGNIKKAMHELRKKHELRFLATDRSVMNLPGIGKSLSFRTIGITNDGRRILEFEYDKTRTHSPIIGSTGNLIMIESKSVKQFLDQLEDTGENVDEYKTIWGYSASETEDRPELFKYPDYKYTVTEQLTNFLSRDELKQEELFEMT